MRQPPMMLMATPAFGRRVQRRDWSTAVAGAATSVTVGSKSSFIRRATRDLKVRRGSKSRKNVRQKAPKNLFDGNNH